MGDDLSKAYDKEFFDTGAGTRELGLDIKYCFEEVYSTFQILAQCLKEKLNPNRVLDVGCAMGFLVKALKGLGVEAWGVDISQYAIGNAPADIRSNLYQGDLTKGRLPFSNHYFDLITFLGTIEYLPDHRQAITETHRALKDKGLLYLETLQVEVDDGLRTNIHDREFWINEFQSQGFVFVPQMLNALLKAQFKHRLLTLEGNTLKQKLAKLLYQRGGAIGKGIVFLVRKLTSPVEQKIEHLLFMKEEIKK